MTGRVGKWVQIPILAMFCETTLFFSNVFRKYEFITNNWEITAEEVALIYKYRWTIELIFSVKLKDSISDLKSASLQTVWITNPHGLKSKVFAC